MNSFDEMLKKQQSSGLTQIVEAAKKSSAYEGGGKDLRFWKATPDKAGNAQALIRFLPAPDQDIPWAKYYEHSFKTQSGKWFWENCPTTIGLDCPVCESNSKNWNAGRDDLKDVARSRKRKLHYVANIIVLKEAANPENEGKVFLLKFGVKIFDKLMGAMEPTFDDEEAFNPFNLLNGAPFKFRQKMVEEYPNYDSSEFGSCEPLFGGDVDKMRSVFEQSHPIGEFISPSNFKSHEDLKKKFNSLTGEGGSSMDSIKSFSAPVERSAPLPSFEDEVSAAESSIIDDDEDIAYFQRLASET